MSAPSQDDLAAFARAEELQAALHRAQRALAEEKRRKDDLSAAVYRAARDAALGQPSPHPIERPRKGKPGQHALLLHLTDWQLGKRTDSYNSDICASRVRQAVEKAMRLVDLHRHAYPVTSAALLLGGDLVEGVDIFPGQAYQVDSGLFEQVFAAAAVVEGAVRTLLREFQDVLVVEEYGNHGRLGRKGELRAEDNTDRMAARIARDRIGQHARADLAGVWLVAPGGHAGELPLPARPRGRGQAVRREHPRLRDQPQEHGLGQRRGGALHGRVHGPLPPGRHVPAAERGACVPDAQPGERQRVRKGSDGGHGEAGPEGPLRGLGAGAGRGGIPAVARLSLPRVVRLPFGFAVRVRIVTAAELARALGWSVTEAQDTDGAWHSDTRTIYLRSTLPPKRRRYVLAHELQHAVTDWAHHLLNREEAKA